MTLYRSLDFTFCYPVGFHLSPCLSVALPCSSPVCRFPRIRCARRSFPSFPSLGTFSLAGAKRARFAAHPFSMFSRLPRTRCADARFPPFRFLTDSIAGCKRTRFAAHLFSMFRGRKRDRSVRAIPCCVYRRILGDVDLCEDRVASAVDAVDAYGHSVRFRCLVVYRAFAASDTRSPLPESRHTFSRRVQTRPVCSAFFFDV